MNTSPAIKKINLFLLKTHIPLGILLIITGLIHGIHSSDQVLSFNMGTVAWVFSILLGMNYMIAKLQKVRNRKWISFHRIFTVVFLLSILIHVVDVGGIQIFHQWMQLKTADAPRMHHTRPLASPPPQSSAQPSDTTLAQSTPQPSDTPSPMTDDIRTHSFGDATFHDGTYTGVADGFGPDLTVSVTLKNNQITDIQILKHHERQARFYARPMADIPPQIIADQSLDIDVVTGATYTSVGIRNAVLDALTQALDSGTLPPLW